MGLELLSSSGRMFKKERGRVQAGLFKELISIPGHDRHSAAYSNQPVRHGVGPLFRPMARNKARAYYDIK